MELLNDKVNSVNSDNNVSPRALGLHTRIIFFTRVVKTNLLSTNKNVGTERIFWIVAMNTKA